MNLINVIQCAELGGMEKVTVRLLRALKPRGVQSELVSLNKIGKLRGLLEDADIPHKGIGYSGPLGVLTAIRLRREILDSEDKDVLLMTGHHIASMLLLPRSKFRNRFLSIHFHHRGEKPDWFWRLTYTIANWKFDRIFFASDFIRQEAEEIAAATAAE